MSELLMLPPARPARAAKTFKYDHRAYFNGAFTSDGEPLFDLVSSQKLEWAYILRRARRISAKGQEHICKTIFEDLGTINTRQQRRALERKLAKQRGRDNRPCHEPKFGSPVPG